MFRGYGVGIDTSKADDSRGGAGIAGDKRED